MRDLRSKFEAIPEIKKKLSMCEWSYGYRVAIKVSELGVLLNG